jgi:hypothetical protein
MSNLWNIANWYHLPFLCSFLFETPFLEFSTLLGRVSTRKSWLKRVESHATEGQGWGCTFDYDLHAWNCYGNLAFNRKHESILLLQKIVNIRTKVANIFCNKNWTESASRYPMTNLTYMMDSPSCPSFLRRLDQSLEWSMSSLNKCLQIVWDVTVAKEVVPGSIIFYISTDIKYSGLKNGGEGIKASW